MFIFEIALSLLTLLLAFSFLGPAALFSPTRLRTRTLSTFDLTPFSANSFAFFFAILRATRSTSDALIFLRSSLGKCWIFVPSSGLPRGIVVLRALEVPENLRGEREGLEWGVRALGCLDDDVVLPLGMTLQRWTRSLRLANLSLLASRAKISSTHSRSYREYILRIQLCAQIEERVTTYHKLHVCETFSQLGVLVSNDPHTFYPCP